MNLLTIPVVAEALKVSEKTVRRLIKRGDLPAFKVGDRGQLRVDEQDLERYVEFSAGSRRRRSRAAGRGANRMKLEKDYDFSIVALDKFIQATRDFGYKGTSSAVAELIDNSLQAGATEIKVTLTSDGDDNHPITLKVIDNGSGMDMRTLRTALRFGGSTRFNDRCGLGRYGMGLPNSSLSQAQRVTVHTWGTKHGQVLESVS